MAIVGRVVEEGIVQVEDIQPIVALVVHIVEVGIVGVDIVEVDIVEVDIVEV